MACSPRGNLAERAEQLEFQIFDMDSNGQPYWNESAYYQFTLKQIEEDIEQPTFELHQMCLRAVDEILKGERWLRRMKIPEVYWDWMRESWNQDAPSLMGRFDLAYDGYGSAKLYEYNADTPTSLYETSVFQWFWLEDVNADLFQGQADQFNSIHNRLVAELRLIGSKNKSLYMACVMSSQEDSGQVCYLYGCATEAGLSPRVLDISTIQTDGSGQLHDETGARIEQLYKLYPWEWLLDEDQDAILTKTKTIFLEPPWKMILSNKGLLAVLWALNPGHPNLLPAYFPDDPKCADLQRFAQKPLYSREGANITLWDGEQLESTEGPYDASSYILQGYHALPNFDGVYPVIGSWIIGDEACGIGIREDDVMITNDTSRFVPHVILD